MLHPSTQRLILRLSEMTETGGIPWRQAASGGGACSFETEGYTVEVATSPLKLRILASGGREIESADAASLGATPGPGGQTLATRVSAMAAAAGRLAGVSDATPGVRLDALASDPAPSHASQTTPDVSPRRPQSDRQIFGAIPSFDQSRSRSPSPATTSAAGGDQLILAGVHAVSVQPSADAPVVSSRSPVLATPVGDASNLSSEGLIPLGQRPPAPNETSKAGAERSAAANPYAPWS